MPDAQPNTPMSSAVMSIPSTGDKGDDTLIYRLQKSENEVKQRAEENIKQRDSRELPAPPQLDRPPDPNQYNRSPMEAFGSAASVLGSLASLLTRHPFTNALNSGAGVLNAYKKQDAAAFDKAMEKWKMDREDALTMANYRQKLYEDLQGRDDADWRVYSSSHKDETAKMALESRDKNNAVRAAIAQSRAMNHAATLTDKRLEIAGKLFDNDIKDFEKVVGREPTQEEVGQMKMNRQGQALTTGADFEKKTSEQKQSQNLVRDIMDATNTIAGSKVMTVGAPSGFTGALEGIKGWMGDTPTEVSDAQAKLAAVKEMFLQTQKGARATAVQKNIDNMIPASHWNANPKAVVEALIDLRNRTILDNNLPYPMIDYDTYMKQRSKLPTLKGNIQENLSNVGSIKSGIQSGGSYQATPEDNNILEGLTY